MTHAQIYRLLPLLFLFLPFPSVLRSIHKNLKVCKVKAPKVHAKTSFSLQQKTLLLYCLKHLVWSRAFTPLTFIGTM